MEPGHIVDGIIGRQLAEPREAAAAAGRTVWGAIPSDHIHTDSSVPAPPSSWITIDSGDMVSVAPIVIWIFVVNLYLHDKTGIAAATLAAMLSGPTYGWGGSAVNANDHTRCLSRIDDQIQRHDMLGKLPGLVTDAPPVLTERQKLQVLSHQLSLGSGKPFPQAVGPLHNTIAEIILSALETANGGAGTADLYKLTAKKVLDKMRVFSQFSGGVVTSRSALTTDVNGNSITPGAAAQRGVPGVAVNAIGVPDSQCAHGDVFGQLFGGGGGGHGGATGRTSFEQRRETREQYQAPRGGGGRSVSFRSPPYGGGGRGGGHGRMQRPQYGAGGGGRHHHPRGGGGRGVQRGPAARVAMAEGRGVEREASGHRSDPRRGDAPLRRSRLLQL